MKRSMKNNDREFLGWDDPVPRMMTHSSLYDDDHDSENQKPGNRSSDSDEIESDEDDTPIVSVPVKSSSNEL